MSESISLRELRAKILADPATKDMIRPSTKNAIYIDVDADGPADFAFISSDLKGNTLDTFAIDLSNDGDFDVYLYNVFDPDKREIVVYPINSDVPMAIVPDSEAIQKVTKLAGLPELLRNFDGPTFAKEFKNVKADIAADYKAGKYSVLNQTVSLRELRAKIKADPATKDMIRPSTKNAIFLDVDGDGPADFAFLSSDPKGDTIDIFAYDVSNDGDFDVYVYNALDEKNWSVVVYPPNSDVPMEVTFGPEKLEGILTTAQLRELLVNFDGPTFAAFFKQRKKETKAYKASGELKG